MDRLCTGFSGCRESGLQPFCTSHSPTRRKLRQDPVNSWGGISPGALALGDQEDESWQNSRLRRRTLSPTGMGVLSSCHVDSPAGNAFTQQTLAEPLLCLAGLGLALGFYRHLGCHLFVGGGTRIGTEAAGLVPVPSPLFSFSWGPPGAGFQSCLPLPSN